MKFLFDRTPELGITEYFIPSEDEKSFTIQTVQDVDAIVEANAEHRKAFTSGRDHWGDQINGDTKVASIPLNVWMDLKRKGIADDPVAFKRWLNDPDNFAFRTRPGSL